MCLFRRFFFCRNRNGNEERVRMRHVDAGGRRFCMSDCGCCNCCGCCGYRGNDGRERYGRDGCFE